MNNEPNFEGEKMKLPVQKVSKEARDGIELKTRGTFIVLIFAALAVILAGMFYWYKTTSVDFVDNSNPIRPTAETNKEPETTNATAQVESFNALSTSNELSTIESDLESTDLSSLLGELPQIDVELEAAVQ